MKKFALTAIAAGVALSGAAHAEVAIDQAGKVNLWGELGFIYDYQDNGQSRDEMAVDIDLGLDFQASENVVASVALASQGTGPDGGLMLSNSSGSSDDLNIDYFYMTYTGLANTAIVAGRAAPQQWSVTEAVVDNIDGTVDGLQVNWGAEEGLGVNVAIHQQGESGSGTFNEDGYTYITQVTFTSAGFGVGFTNQTADANTTGSDGDMNTLGAIFSQDAFYAGFEYVESDASTDETGYILDLGYNLDDASTVSVEAFDFEANALVSTLAATGEDFDYATLKGFSVKYARALNDTSSIQVSLHNTELSSGVGSDTDALRAEYILSF